MWALENLLLRGSSVEVKRPNKRYYNTSNREMSPAYLIRLGEWKEEEKDFPELVMGGDTLDLLDTCIVFGNSTLFRGTKGMFC